MPPRPKSRRFHSATFSPPPRQYTFPGYHTITRRKPRRWPLVLRVTKGSVHVSILLPVLLHSIITALVVYLNLYWHPLGVSGTVVPSLSIVVGLMLVFRNGTSYDRFWAGRNHMAGIVNGVRSLSRTFLVSSRGLKTDQASEEELRDTETVVRLLIAVLYSVKHHLRSEFAPSSTAPTAPGAPYPGIPSTAPSGARTPIAGISTAMTTSGILSASARVLARSATSTSTLHDPTRSSHASNAVYTHLLTRTPVPSLEARGVALPFQLSLSVEAYIRRGLQRDWWLAPQAAMLEATLNALLLDFAKMDTIRSTPIPIAHLVHTRQVLALYLMALPFALVDEMTWWAIAVVALISFTLYGIEGIGRQLEDPFGYDRNDIKMDAIILDLQEEIEAVLEEWKAGGGCFN